MMNVSSLVTNASASASTSLQGQASILVLKKAMQLQETSALQLLQSATAPVPTSRPAGPIGGNIDTFA